MTQTKIHLEKRNHGTERIQRGVLFWIEPVWVRCMMYTFWDKVSLPQIWGSIKVKFGARFCWWFRNPPPVEAGSLSHYLQGFMHLNWLFGISSISSATAIVLFIRKPLWIWWFKNNPFELGKILLESHHFHVKPPTYNHFQFGESFPEILLGKIWLVITKHPFRTGWIAFQDLLFSPRLDKNDKFLSPLMNFLESHQASIRSKKRFFHLDNSSKNAEHRKFSWKSPKKIPGNFTKPC